jgi:general stress protein YciG
MPQGIEFMRRYKPHELRFFFEQELVKQIVKHRGSGLSDKAMQDVLLQWGERLKLTEGAHRRKTTYTPSGPERDEAGRFVTGSPATYAAASKGGSLTSGKFVKGQERTREAGRKAAAARWSKDKAPNNSPPGDD